MPKETPLPDWTGQDVYLIGGGHSLRKFNFAQLRKLNTIGCNQAFALGADVCKVVTFGDHNFWHTFHRDGDGFPDLEHYGGWVVSNYWLGDGAPSWLKFYRRIDTGLGTGDALAWNNNTGALAINVALMMGAKRVFLLGYDLRYGPRHAKHHWHDMAIESPRPGVYDKFQAGFQQVNAALAATYPGAEVWNVTQGDSRLTVFPRISFGDLGLTPPTEIWVPTEKDKKDGHQ